MVLLRDQVYLLMLQLCQIVSKLFWRSQDFDGDIEFVFLFNNMFRYIASPEHLIHLH